MDGQSCDSHEDPSLELGKAQAGLEQGIMMLTSLGQSSNTSNQLLACTEGGFSADVTAKPCALEPRETDMTGLDILATFQTNLQQTLSLVELMSPDQKNQALETLHVAITPHGDTAANHTTDTKPCMPESDGIAHDAAPAPHVTPTSQSIAPNPAMPMTGEVTVDTPVPVQSASSVVSSLLRSSSIYCAGAPPDCFGISANSRSGPVLDCKTVGNTQEGEKVEIEAAKSLPSDEVDHHHQQQQQQQQPDEYDIISGTKMDTFDIAHGCSLDAMKCLDTMPLRITSAETTTTDKSLPHQHNPESGMENSELDIGEPSVGAVTEVKRKRGRPRKVTKAATGVSVTREGQGSASSGSSVGASVTREGQRSASSGSSVGASVTREGQGSASSGSSVRNASKREAHQHSPDLSTDSYSGRPKRQAAVDCRKRWSGFTKGGTEDGRKSTKPAPVSSTSSSPAANAKSPAKGPSSKTSGPRGRRKTIPVIESDEDLDEVKAKSSPLKSNVPAEGRRNLRSFRFSTRTTSETELAPQEKSEGSQHREANLQVHQKQYTSEEGPPKGKVGTELDDSEDSVYDPGEDADGCGDDSLCKDAAKPQNSEGAETHLKANCSTLSPVQTEACVQSAESSEHTQTVDLTSATVPDDVVVNDSKDGESKEVEEAADATNATEEQQEAAYIPIKLSKQDGGGFLCPVCIYTAKSRSNITIHLRRHTGERPFTCAQCSKGFQTLSNLQRHKRETHEGKKPFSCLQCSRGFFHKKLYEKHLRKVHKEDDGTSSSLVVEEEEARYQCPLCGKPFKSKSFLKAHQVIHEGSKPHACTQCGRKFSFKNNLIRHVRIHTGQRPHKCTECDAAFIERKSLVLHQRKGCGKIKLERVEYPHQCTNCGKGFQSRSSLSSHEVTHTKERPFQCKACGKHFSHKNNMRRHMRTHTGERPYSCPDCGKGFTEKKSVDIHRRLHTGEKPFACGVCGKRFAQVSTLQSHRPVHTKERNFHCKLCSKTFLRHSHFNLHMHQHNKDPALSCSVCNMKFYRKGDLKRHSVKHTNEKPYVCYLCPKRFTRLQYLKEHLNMHTGERPHKCKYCDKTFPDVSSCYRHTSIHLRPLQVPPPPGQLEKQQQPQQPVVVAASVAGAAFPAMPLGGQVMRQAGGKKAEVQTWFNVGSSQRVSLKIEPRGGAGVPQAVTSMNTLAVQEIPLKSLLPQLLTVVKQEQEVGASILEVASQEVEPPSGTAQSVPLLEDQDAVASAMKEVGILEEGNSLTLQQDSAIVLPQGITQADPCTVVSAGQAEATLEGYMSLEAMTRPAFGSSSKELQTSTTTTTNNIIVSGSGATVLTTQEIRSLLAQDDRMACVSQLSSSAPCAGSGISSISEGAAGEAVEAACEASHIATQDISSSFSSDIQVSNGSAINAARYSASQDAFQDTQVETMYSQVVSQQVGSIEESSITVGDLHGGDHENISITADDLDTLLTEGGEGGVLIQQEDGSTQFIRTIIQDVNAEELGGKEINLQEIQLPLGTLDGDINSQHYVVIYQ